MLKLVVLYLCYVYLMYNRVLVERINILTCKVIKLFNYVSCNVPCSSTRDQFCSR